MFTYIYKYIYICVCGNVSGLYSLKTVWGVRLSIGLGSSWLG